MTEWTEGISLMGGPVILRDGLPAPFDAVLSALRATGWRTIETAPKDGTQILVWNGKHVRQDSQRIGEFAGPQKDGQPTSGRMFQSPRPTHWQPLPPPPTEKE